MYALSANTSAQFNVALGYSTLAANTTGEYNTAVGTYALDAASTNSSNVAIGYASLGACTASNNTSVGSYSLDACTTGNYNVALGIHAGGALTTSPANTLIGSEAGLLLVDGDGMNVFIGNDAGDESTDTNRSILVGNNANASNASGTTKEVVVAHDADGKGSNTAFIGGTSGAYNGANSSSWSTTSDRRIKKNIVNNNTGLDILNQIQVRNFEYKTQDEIKTDNPELTDVVKSAAVDQQGLQLGVIAQEIEGVLPEVVETQTTGVKTVNPDNLTWYLVNAVKELSAKVEELESKLNN